MPYRHILETVSSTPGAKSLIDWTAVVTSIAAFAGVIQGVLAFVGSVLSVCWLVVSLLEKPSVQRFINWVFKRGNAKEPASEDHTD